jgi:hypothetical protein
MSKWVLIALALVGCAGPTAVAPPPAPAPPPPKGLALAARSVGPVTADTPANLVALREVLAGYTVKPSNRGMFSDLHFEVWKGDELLFHVIPADDGSIFNIHVVSKTVDIANRPWRVGARFTHASYITHCECWGQMPVCYRKGDHVAIAIERECGETGALSEESRRQFAGGPINRAVWNPKPFGDEPESQFDVADPDPCAGP